MLKRVESIAAVLLTLLVLAVHVQRVLHAGGLWRDEAGAVQLATLPTLEEVYQRFPHEAFPMLFPAILRGYTALSGGSDLALRLFGMAVGMAILAALWLNARAAGTVPLASVALLGLHPWFLVYGDSIRGYGLGIVLILLTFGAFARLVARPDRRAIIFAAVAAVLSVHCLLHNSALLLGMGMAAAAVGVVRRWRMAAAALGVGLLAAVSLLPYFRPLSAARDWDILLVEELRLRQILASFGAIIIYPSPAMLWAWVLFLVTGVAAALWALSRGAGPDSDADDARLFRLLTLPAVFAAQCGLFLVLGYLPRIWYCLPLMAVAASALDGLLARLPAGLRVARLAAAVLLPVLLLPSVTLETKKRMTNVDLVARHLEEHVGRRDLVVVNPWYFGVSFHRYYQGEARWITVPGLDDHRMHRYDLVKTRMMSHQPLGDLFFAVRRTLRAGHRVWVVGAFDAPPPGESPPVLGPAPGAPSGWRDGPYTVAWNLQLGDYLRKNAEREEGVHVPPATGINPLEHLTLRSFQGWRRKAPDNQPLRRAGG
ncbi:MAG TPA: hypothetical protein VN493_31190 [Thermoanaerobaculia bacterium]|nr:hypothetical protein [Thermoanaerobaculia bacterium]